VRSDGLYNVYGQNPKHYKEVSDLVIFERDACSVPQVQRSFDILTGQIP
jgi:hypothetical protein